MTLVVGVDENGYGPRLGPLIATAVLIEVPAYDRAELQRAGMAAGVRDSKQVSAFGKMAHAESLALGLLEQLHGETFADVDGLFSKLCLDDLPSLRAPCPSKSAPQCWGPQLALPAFGGDPARAAPWLASMEGLGVQVQHASSAALCARRFNDELDAGVSKSVVDLGLFERLLLDARAAADGDLVAYCGMVGGMLHYPKHFRALCEREVTPVVETRAQRAYEIAGLGQVSFEVHADDRHLPVALASIVGKYVRELWMERQNRFYQGHDPSLRRASGYHDSVTTAFMDGTAALRARRGIADDCFLRRR